MNVLKLLLLTLFILFSSSVNAGDNEDDIDDKGFLITIAFGALISVVGLLLKNSKSTSKLGEYILIPGLVITGLPILYYAFSLLEWAARSLLNLAFYVAIVGIIGYLIYQIILSFRKNKSE